MNPIKEIEKNALNEVFKKSHDFLVVGLTGRTGSGCTTCANILSEKILNLPSGEISPYKGDDVRKFRIVSKFISANWQPFIVLKVTSIITENIFSQGMEDFYRFVDALKGQDAVLQKYKDKIEEKFKEYVVKRDLVENEINQFEKKFNFYYEEICEFTEFLKKILNEVEIGLYTQAYQKAGDNIRSSGKYYDSNFASETFLNFPKKIHDYIKLALDYKKDKNEDCRIVVDAIRNPYEAMYLNNHIANFFLIAVNTENLNRINHLKRNYKINETQLKLLDDKEYPKKLVGSQRFVSQNIQKCIEIADIHINNPRSDHYGHMELRCQLAWYVTLMLHAGLITPTMMESCMQVAYSVKKNSGCISRQVGAAISDADYSIKAVGWNNTPEGQVPCILRNVSDLVNGYDSEAYSYYERNDAAFRKEIKIKYINVLQIGDKDSTGLNISYCFKDVQNSVEQEKNQVHTRALHAEENAFLQIVKHGGQAMKKGILFSTASPCELCAKKAYQIGVSKIIYIDPYPGITTSHILKSGNSSPELILYRGAVGRAYDKLYQPIMPFKDELNFYYEIPSFKKPTREEINKLKSDNKRLQDEIQELRNQLENRLDK
jgi:deoxycytidylate deaminase